MNANPGDVLMKILAPARYHHQVQRFVARLQSRKAAPAAGEAGQPEMGDRPASHRRQSTYSQRSATIGSTRAARRAGM